MIGGDCTKPAETTNTGFMTRWNQTKESRRFQMYGRIHANICNVPVFILPGVKIHIKLTKSKSEFYLLSAKADPKVYFKFEEALLYVKRIRASPSIPASHNEALLTGHPARYNFTRVELKTFTFGSGSK
jgi:hypothetical protein